MVDAADLESAVPKAAYGFEFHPRHQLDFAEGHEGADLDFSIGGDRHSHRAFLLGVALTLT
jgi:hypothetical protein